MDEKAQATSDALQNYDSDGTMFLFGVVPLIVVGVLAAVWFVVYMYKKKKSEADLAAAMIDDGESGKVQTSNFNTRDLQELDPTKPSQRISGVKTKAE